MSRIGKMPIIIPKGVDIKIEEGNKVTVKGPKATLFQKLPEVMTIELKDGVINIVRPNDLKKNKSLHGLSRSLLNNMVIGVTKGFEKKLEINGVGYKAALKGNKIVLNLGYSHPIELELPAGITLEVPSNTSIIVKGSDKQVVGQFAAVIRSKRKPEPYLGKGIKYSDEYIRRKEGKTGAV